MGRSKAIEYGFFGLFMAIVPLMAARIVVTVTDSESAILARTMILTTLSLTHIFVALGSRSETGSVFSRSFLVSGKFFWRIGISLVFILIVTELAFLQNRLETTSLLVSQWALAILLASVLLWVMEIVKFFKRRGIKKDASAV
jgi:Ca2+-transporting ATPase